MTVYLFLIGLTVMTYILGKAAGNKQKMNKSTIAVFFIGMFLLIWLRAWNIGTDTYNYLAMYNRAKENGILKLFKVYGGEYGYFALNMLIGAVYDDYQFFFFCIGLVSLLPVAIFYAKHSENALISIGLFLLFLFPMYFSGLRQICAMAFVIPAYYATKEKKLAIFILCVIGAMLFHASAFILALLYPVYHMNIKKTWFPVLVPLFFFAYLLRTQIFTILISFLSLQYRDAYDNFTTTSAITVWLLMIIFVVYTYMVADKEKMDREAIGQRNLLVLSMSLQMFASINSVAMRLNYYYLLLVPIIMSKYVRLSSKRYRQVTKLADFIIGVFFIGYFVVQICSGADLLDISPYEFYFEH